VWHAPSGIEASVIEACAAAAAVSACPCSCPSDACRAHASITLLCTGFDKASFVYELFARGLRFRVHPGLFVLHMPHHTPDSHSTDRSDSRPPTNCSAAARPAAPSPASAASAAEPSHAQPMSPSAAEEEEARRRNPGETCVRAFLSRMRRPGRATPTKALPCADAGSWPLVGGECRGRVALSLAPRRVPDAICRVPCA